MYRAALLSFCCLAIAGPAAAAGHCNQPYAPVIKVTASMTSPQMATLRSDVLAFLAASDVYQKCLSTEMISLERDRKLEASQAAKERIGREFNAVVKSFKVASSASAP